MNNIPDAVKDWIKECQKNRVSLAMALVGVPASNTIVWDYLAPHHLDADQYEYTIDFDRANSFAKEWLNTL